MCICNMVACCLTLTVRVDPLIETACPWEMKQISRCSRMQEAYDIVQQFRERFYLKEEKVLVVPGDCFFLC